MPITSESLKKWPRMGPKPKLTHKMKVFAEKRVEGLSIPKAYQAAGYCKSSFNPYRVVKLPQVQTYIKKLEERAMKKHDITVEKVLTDLESAKELAMHIESPAAAVNATMAQAKVVGLIVDKVERKEVSEMDKHELAAAVKDALGDQQGDALLKAMGMAPEKPAEQWKDFPATGTVQ